MERIALYTALRMNWLLDPTIEADEWQITNYRELPLEEIFSRLKEIGLDIAEEEFYDFSYECDTPEELIEALADEYRIEEKDQAALLIFELWRRLLPEKLCLSIFCDELDQQIFLYDQGKESEEGIEDILANLEMLLNDYVDQGEDPIAVFDIVSNNCANDVENFLYDFIASKINEGNVTYASELIDDFEEFVPNPKWLYFFKARIIANDDPIGANMILEELTEEAESEHDIEFNFALLNFLIHEGGQELFQRIVQATLPLLEFEEDFRELLQLCKDYFRLLDLESDEKAVDSIMSKRDEKKPHKEIDPKDPDFSLLLEILSKSTNG